MASSGHRLGQRTLALAPRVAIERRVRGDAPRPGAERAAAVEAIDVAERLQEGLLGGVERFLGILEDPVGCTVDRLPMQCDQTGEGLSVSNPRSI